MQPRASPADTYAGYNIRRHAAAVHTFQRSLGNGTDSAVAMVRRSVLVHTDTGMVDPSDVCSGDQQTRPSPTPVTPSKGNHDALHAGYPRRKRHHASSAAAACICNRLYVKSLGYRSAESVAAMVTTAECVMYDATKATDTEAATDHSQAGMLHERNNTQCDGA